jgi:hypothetical protein
VITAPVLAGSTTTFCADRFAADGAFVREIVEPTGAEAFIVNRTYAIIPSPRGSLLSAPSTPTVTCPLAVFVVFATGPLPLFRYKTVTPSLGSIYEGLAAVVAAPMVVPTYVSRAVSYPMVESAAGIPSRQLPRLPIAAVSVGGAHGSIAATASFQA